MFNSQRGISLIETTIGLSLVVIAVTTAIVGYNPERQKAEDVLQHLHLVKAGMLRYNMDYPPSTTRLDNLLAPSENDQAYWNGPYVEGPMPLKGPHFDISNVFSDTHLELKHETIDGVHYQAVVVKGNAESYLRHKLLAQCGNDCLPFPNQNELGLLIQKANANSSSSTGFSNHPISATRPPSAPSHPWIGPLVTAPATVTPTYSPPPIPTRPLIPVPSPTPLPGTTTCDVVACTNPSPSPPATLPYDIALPPPPPPPPAPVPNTPAPPTPVPVETSEKPSIKIVRCTSFSGTTPVSAYCNNDNPHGGTYPYYKLQIYFVPLDPTIAVNNSTLGYISIGPDTGRHLKNDGVIVDNTVPDDAARGKREGFEYIFDPPNKGYTDNTLIKTEPFVVMSYSMFYRLNSIHLYFNPNLY